MDQGSITGWGVSCGRQKSHATFKTALSRRIVLFCLVFVSVATTRIEAGAGDDAGFERFRVIVEKNMFARPHGRDGKAAQPPESSSTANPEEVKLVGIVRMRNPLSSIAIIEKGGRHRLCRVGDRVGTLVLRSIRDHDIVFESPAGLWLAEIEPGTAQHRRPAVRRPPDSTDLVRATDPSAPPYRRRLPVRAVDVKQLAEAGLIAYAEDGVVKGLELTRNTMGLKKGDRVTHVDGQSLCAKRPRQKLWQIVRKRSVSRMPPSEIRVVIERDRRTLELLVSLVG
ncbi:hypothetical protein [Anaerobaca lacustris]|uniref:PDZ domain-containing protein n=1 Tax=Anaerobaca lacustris TaxID=3044600 RepID=A0AAW6U3B7_9BACT|nr:hypothetical protein [Sedimentisphaerales bacterium M17dextr]